MTPYIGLRLLPLAELLDDPRPEACVEIRFGPVPPSRDPTAIPFPNPIRISPADLVRLHAESALALSRVRCEVTRAEIAWEKALGDWYAEGRRAADAREPDTALLARVLESLRRKDVVRV
ncbi:hypothetical protein [Streptomyces sp. NPDC052179]|uniref:hypothetical protein n=1 Tax=Streptomyces sp. NPDC052179 TaxID=3155680 RepID=UPI003420A980